MSPDALHKIPFPQQGQNLVVLVTPWLEPLTLHLTSLKICMTKPVVPAYFGDHLLQEPQEFHQKPGWISGLRFYSFQHWLTKPITSSLWKRNSLQLPVWHGGCLKNNTDFCFFLSGQFSSQLLENGMLKSFRSGKEKGSAQQFQPFLGLLLLFRFQRPRGEK